MLIHTERRLDMTKLIALFVTMRTRLKKMNFLHSDHYMCTIVHSLFDCLDSPFMLIFTANYVKNWRPKQKQRRLIIYHI